MMNKRELVKLLWGLAIQDAEAIATREAFADKTDALWKADEWIYVKDIEVSLKRVHEEIESGRAAYEGDVVDLIFSRDVGGVLTDINNEYFSEKIRDCQESLYKLSNEP